MRKVKFVNTCKAIRGAPRIHTRLCSKKCYSKTYIPMITIAYRYSFNIEESRRNIKHENREDGHMKFRP
jgi:hypothetical protein